VSVLRVVISSLRSFIDPYSFFRETTLEPATRCRDFVEFSRKGRE